ncbi:MAG: NAD(P)H-binding protein [Planctomycetota bacterium]
MSSPIFVAGATGYTGRAVVAALRERDLPTVAHVRPDSPRLEEWRARFATLGATVDATPWEPAALAATLRRLAPATVFALLGTTARRAGREGRRATEAYEQIDYGLTKMLIDAAGTLDPPPRLVYLSSIGVHPGVRNPYLAARARAEEALAASGLPHVIARPSFITGPDRDEARLGERVGAALADCALGVVGALGGRRLRDLYRSTTNQTLGRALVRLALEAREPRVIAEGADLR